MCSKCEEIAMKKKITKADQNLARDKRAPTLDRSTLNKIGSQLRSYFDPLEHTPTPAMVAALEKLNG